MRTLPSISAFAALLLLPAAAEAQVIPTRAAMQRLAATTLEDFESYSIGYGGAVNTGTLTMDENTIANGQGPGLVEDGCVYSCSSNTLQWNGQGYYGMPSKNFLANTGDGVLTLVYDSPVTQFGFDLYAFSGFSDSTVIRVYDAGGALIFTSSAISVPGAGGVFFGYTAASIGSVQVDSQVYSWSTMIDDHEYGGGGPSIALSGSCPGAVTLNASDFTPFGGVAVAIALSAGSFTIPAGSCAGTQLGLASPSLVTVLTADANGAASLGGNLPPAFCGRSLQAVDLATCTPSNVITL